MAEGGGAPPSEAMRGARGVSVAIAAVIAVVLFLAGLGVGWLVFSPPASQVNKLFLGTNTPFPPFEFRNETDVLVGFDIELIETVVERGFGFEACTETVRTRCYDWVDFREFSPLLFAVGEGRIDIAVGAITMNGDTGAERNGSMDFSNPYYESDQGVLKRANDATNYCAAENCTAQELNVTGRDVGVQAITTSEFWVADNLKAVNALVLPSVEEVLLALEQGTVDIVVIDLPAAEGFSAQNPAFAVEGTIQTDELFGFAVANGDPKGLVRVINAQLAAFRQDGTYDDLIAKWFS